MILDTSSILVTIFFILFIILILKIGFKWKTWHKSALISLLLYVLLNIFLVPMFQDSYIGLNLFFVSIGPGFLIISLINDFFVQIPFSTKIILASLYSSAIYILFGIWVGAIISRIKEEYKLLDLEKKKQKKNKKKRNSKGQASLELIAILSILVIAAVIVGMYYLNNMNKKSDEFSEVDVMVSDLEDRLDGGFNNDFSSGRIPTVDTSDDICKAPSAHCFDGIKNCDELNIDCGGNHCEKCGLQQFEIILNPPGAIYNIGDDVVFSANIKGGTGPYDCKWKLDGSEVDDSCGSYSHYFNSSGTFKISFEVEDKSDNTIKIDDVEVEIS